jgi:hypothetical protein
MLVAHAVDCALMSSTNFSAMHNAITALRFYNHSVHYPQRSDWRCGNSVLSIRSMNQPFICFICFHLITFSIKYLEIQITSIKFEANKITSCFPKAFRFAAFWLVPHCPKRDIAIRPLAVLGQNGGKQFYQTPNNKTNSMGLSPRTNFTGWATVTCRRNLVSTLVDRGVSRGQRGGSHTAVNLSFLDRSRYFSFK